MPSTSLVDSSRPDDRGEPGDRSVRSPGHAVEAAAGAAESDAGRDRDRRRKAIRLSGRRATQQLIATIGPPTARSATQTRSVEWVSLNPEIAPISPKGRVVPLAQRDGDDRRPPRQPRGRRATVTVEGMDQPAPVSFRRDVIPAFSQAGCNMGACHGTPTGKGGFRLSLRGYLPDQDFAILSREAGGRRINPIAPETSLILRKPLGEVPHEGGLRLARSSKTYEFLHDWIKEGAKDDPGAPRPSGSRSCPSRAC